MKDFRIKLSLLRIILATATSAFLLPATTTRAATASGSPANGTYKIIARSSGLALDVEQASTTSGTLIDTWPYNSQTTQQWTLARLANGSYEVIEVQSGNALDVLHQSTTTGTNLDLRPYLGQASQRWLLTPMPGGYYTIQEVQSGKFLEARNQGDKLTMEKSNGTSNQQWSFQAVTTVGAVSMAKPTVSAAKPTVSTVSAVTPTISTVGTVPSAASTATAVTPTVSTVSAVTPTVITATVVASAASPISAANSSIGPPVATLTANGSTQAITVQACDAYQNNISTGGATVVFSVSGTGTISATTDNGNGTYSATLTAPASVGTGTVTATLNGSPVGTAVYASQSVATYYPATIGAPVPNLTSALTTSFTAGGATFQTVYYPSTGLGPVYNNTSCANCHDFPVTGGGGSNLSTRFGSSTNGVFNPLTSLGGTLLHAAYINANCVETLPASANVVALRRVRALFGAGLIEAIPDSVIENNATIANVDNIVGTVAYVTDPVDGNVHAGRFGWKGQYASILAFVADAENNEIGLTNRFEPTGHAPNGNTALYNEYNVVPNPKDVINSTTGKANCDTDSDYVRLLSPAPTVPLTATALAGQALFHQISCDECHTPVLTTGTAFTPISDLASETSAPIAALSNQAVPLYSDLLLHNMGALNDGIAQGAASPNQMMTAPLWGLRYKMPYLHNGSATNSVDAAIRAHAGDALPAATRYITLTTTQQQDLVAFLNSL